MPASIEQTLLSAKQQLIDAGQTDSPQLDAELLLAHCLQKSRTYLFTWPDQILSPEQQKSFDHLLALRCQGKPIAHLTGWREFWGLELKVTADTLIPRPDTETLIEAVLDLQLAPDAKILDMGTGTGAIALALKSELPQASVTALDMSPAALAVAQENADRLGLDVEFLHSNWFSAVNDYRFDCIVSNPPYIEEADPHLQQGDVRFEPITALTSGTDGLDDIRMIIQQAVQHLNPGAWIAIEHGYNQAQAIAQLFVDHDYHNIRLCTDYGGNPRITLAQKPNLQQ